MTGDPATGGAPEAVRGEAVRDEAARLARRLDVAGRLLDEARPPRHQPPRHQPPRIDDDDELRDLLNPAIDRVTRLVSLARSLADGTLPEESAGEAARAIAATQPARRPR